MLQKAAFVHRGSDPGVRAAQAVQRETLAQ